MIGIVKKKKVVELHSTEKSSLTEPLVLDWQLLIIHNALFSILLIFWVLPNSRHLILYLTFLIGISKIVLR